MRIGMFFREALRSIRANAELIGGNYETAADVAEGVVAEDETDVESLLTLAAAESARVWARQRAASSGAAGWAVALTAQRTRTARVA